MTQEDKKQLREKIRVIAGDTSDGLDDPKYNYLVYRTVKVVEHALKEAEARGYVTGWNAACEHAPEPMKPTKKSYGFKDV